MNHSRVIPLPYDLAMSRRYSLGTIRYAAGLLAMRHRWSKFKEAHTTHPEVLSVTGMKSTSHASVYLRDLCDAGYFNNLTKSGGRLLIDTAPIYSMIDGFNKCGHTNMLVSVLRDRRITGAVLAQLVCYLKHGRQSQPDKPVYPSRRTIAREANLGCLQQVSDNDRVLEDMGLIEVLPSEDGRRLVSLLPIYRMIEEGIRLDNAEMGEAVRAGVTRLNPSPLPSDPCPLDDSPSAHSTTPPLYIDGSSSSQAEEEAAATRARASAPARSTEPTAAAAPSASQTNSHDKPHKNQPVLPTGHPMVEFFDGCDIRMPMWKMQNIASAKPDWHTEEWRDFFELLEYDTRLRVINARNPAGLLMTIVWEDGDAILTGSREDARRAREEEKRMRIVDAQRLRASEERRRVEDDEENRKRLELRRAAGVPDICPEDCFPALWGVVSSAMVYYYQNGELSKLLGPPYKGTAYRSAVRYIHEHHLSLDEYLPAHWIAAAYRETNVATL